MQTEPSSEGTAGLADEVAAAQRSAVEAANLAAWGWLGISYTVILSGFLLCYLGSFTTTGQESGQSYIFVIFCFIGVYRGACDRLRCAPRRQLSIDLVAPIAIFAVIMATAWRFTGHPPSWPLSITLTAMCATCGLSIGIRRVIRSRRRPRAGLWSSQPLGAPGIVGNALVAVSLGLSALLTTENPGDFELVVFLAPWIGIIVWGAFMNSRWGPQHVGALWRGRDWAAALTGVSVVVGSSVAVDAGHPAAPALLAALIAAAALPLIAVTLAPRPTPAASGAESSF